MATAASSVLYQEVPEFLLNRVLAYRTGLVDCVNAYRKCLNNEIQGDAGKYRNIRFLEYCNVLTPKHPIEVYTKVTPLS